VLFLKHLLRGVSLGLFDEATAMEKFQKWHDEHESRIRQREDESRKARRIQRTPPFVKKVEKNEEEQPSAE
jgi:small subunit ribosomal protein S16